MRFHPNLAVAAVNLVHILLTEKWSYFLRYAQRRWRWGNSM